LRLRSRRCGTSQTGSPIHPGRVASRSVWASYWSEDYVDQSTQSRILLANHANRLHNLLQKKQKMSGIQERNTRQVRNIAQHYIPWPFVMWGMDIIRSFPPGKGQCKFLLVGVDYFTEWIETEPLAVITTRKVHNFVWKSIVCRFSIPYTIVTDNSLHFTERALVTFYKGL